MRVHKILADAGVASRRGAERLMSEGRVAVNGSTVTAPGAQADPARDAITVDGRPLGGPSRHIYVALNKPPGVVTTARDPQGRPTASALVARPERLFTVGRLDRDTEGLLLLTNDGAWANKVAHPSGGVEKEYEAIVDGVPGSEALQRLADGVALPDGHLGRGEVRLIEELDGRARISLTLHEGHKRQARLMLGAIGYPVRRLVRVRIGGLQLPALASGAWRELTPAEVAAVTWPPRPRAKSPRDEPRRAAGEEHRRGQHDGRRVREPRQERGDTHAVEETRRQRGSSVGHRDRRARGVGQVDDRAGAGERVGPVVPGHGHDVSRRDVAGPAARHRPRR